MDHRYIEEHQVIDRYLMHQLPPGEAVRFEEHYMHCQQCLDELELAEKLRRGLRRAVADDTAALTAARRFGLLAWLARRARSPAAGLTAAALVAALVLPLGLMVRQLQHLGRERDEARTAAAELRRQQAGAPQPQINPLLISLSPERATAIGEAAIGEADPSHIVRLRAEPEWIVLSLEIGSSGHPAYRVVLVRGGQEVWRGDGLEPDSAGSLVLAVHSTWLGAGDYSVRVETAPAAGDARPIAHFSLRVIAPG